MTSWLITGARGQLGSDLVAILTAAGESVIGLGSAELDITDAARIETAMAVHRPDVIINAAAYTAVDAAETDEDRAHLVNGVGPGLLAAAAARRGARLLHVSTDYVFSGDGPPGGGPPVDGPPGGGPPVEVPTGGGPPVEVPTGGGLPGDGLAGDPGYAPGDPVGPRSAYGRTKLAGEVAVRELAPDHGYVIRTAWVYGVIGNNFVKTMARLEKAHDTVSVVDDQRGSPTWSADLAAGLIELAQSAAPPGIYHCTNGGDTTWFGFTQAIFEELGVDPGRVRPTTSEAYPRPAPRPAYSVLSAQQWRDANLTPLRPWREALTEAVEGGLLAEAATAD